MLRRMKINKSIHLQSMHYTLYMMMVYHELKTASDSPRMVMMRQRQRARPREGRRGHQVRELLLLLLLLWGQHEISRVEGVGRRGRRPRRLRRRRLTHQRRVRLLPHCGCGSRGGVVVQQVGVLLVEGGPADGDSPGAVRGGRGGGGLVHVLQLRVPVALVEGVVVGLGVGDGHDGAVGGGEELLAVEAVAVLAEGGAAARRFLL